MNKSQASKLQKLARHLEKGKLGHRKFDFSKFHSACGTAGCAAGELPFLFPEEWHLLAAESGSSCIFPRLEQKHAATVGSYYSDYTFDDLRLFFGIGKLAVRHLFYPNWQSVGRFGGTKLSQNASRYQVARNMRIFIRRWKAKQVAASVIKSGFHRTKLDHP